jgi:hypothetical protein
VKGGAKNVGKKHMKKYMSKWSVWVEYVILPIELTAILFILIWLLPHTFLGSD